MVRRRPVVALFVLALSACSADSGTYMDYPPSDDGGDNIAPGNHDLGRRTHPAPDLGHRPGADLAMPQSIDFAVPSQSFVDMAMNQVPNTGVGAKGGSVELLHFGISGDTRPPSCEDTQGYPTAIINSIGMQFKTRGVQFAIDLGDHMYVCNNDLNTAQAQMSLYMKGTKLYGGTWFMTEGNHECYKGPCLAGSQNANYVAFMAALAPISDSPYYSFNVNTSLGLATFVVIADNSWDNTQANWLDQTLATADKDATYTIVTRHHPEGDSSVVTNSASMQILRAHKFALFLTGHNHLYKHMQVDGGRDLIMGNSGAPLIAGGSFYGYGVVDQLKDGKLQITIWDLNNNNAPVDTWSVGANQ